MLSALNDGLFEELDAARPVVNLYRRELQRNYVMLLLASAGTASDPQPRPETPPSEEPFGLTTLEARSVEWPSSPLAERAGHYRASKQRPSEFRAALRDSLVHLSDKIDQALRKTTDRRTASHLRDLRAELREKMGSSGR